MAPVLLLFIVASVIPIVIPLFKQGAVSRIYRIAAGLTLISGSLQTLFVICEESQWMTIDKSTRFAIFGIPACLLALVLATVGTLVQRQNATTSMAIGLVSPVLGLVIWMIFITLH